MAASHIATTIEAIFEGKQEQLNIRYSQRDRVQRNRFASDFLAANEDTPHPLAQHLDNEGARHLVTDIW